MMATLWLENVAHQTIASSLVLRVTKIEAPENRYLAWICCHCLKEAPDEQNKEHIEEDED